MGRCSDLAQARAVRCLLVRQSKEKKERQKQQTKRKRIMLLILAMGSDFRCSVGTVKSRNHAWKRGEAVAGGRESVPISCVGMMAVDYTAIVWCL